MAQLDLLVCEVFAAVGSEDLLDQYSYIQNIYLKHEDADLL